MSYQIAWRNLETGATGVGSKKTWEDINEVEALVDEMTQEYPGFEYTVVVVGSPPQFQSTPKSGSVKVSAGYAVMVTRYPRTPEERKEQEESFSA